MGWAIPRRKVTQFSFKQKRFVYDQFVTGEETGTKTYAEKAVAKIRLLRNENGEKAFKPKDYLTIDQMTPVFGRMASQKKKRTP